MSGHASQQLAQQDLLCNKQGMRERELERVRQKGMERAYSAKKEGKEEKIKKRGVVMI